MTDRDVEALLAWYSRVRRPLPWRFTREPYAILVSEVMLQQTQAARVVSYFERWMARFPDVAALAGAPVRDVLVAWSGLGYNRRALALQAAARSVAAGGWPPPERLTDLPGVGPYTAAALASFAWDAPVAAIDTNVRRVLERHDGRRRGDAELRRRATALLPPRRAGEFNQAMMELGATVCRARRPACDGCPVRAGCASAGRGLSALSRPVGGEGAAAGLGPASSRRAVGGEGAAAGRAPASSRRPVGGEGAAVDRAPVSSRRDAGRAPEARGLRPRVRFEDTDRWARGRIVAALVAGQPPPPLNPARRERSLAGLERDGLIARGHDGEPRLP